MGNTAVTNTQGLTFMAGTWWKLGYESRAIWLWWILLCGSRKWFDHCIIKEVFMEKMSFGRVSEGGRDFHMEKIRVLDVG